MTRGGRHSDTDTSERRCIALMESLPKERMIRFVLSPDHVVTPDIAERLPGRGIWVSADRKALKKAIARNLFVMSGLRTPIVTVVTGEGGSGGALAIGVADRVLMLQYSVYSVISPEGCASILWRTRDKAEAAAEAMGITAERLQSLGLIDEVIAEPLGGAHRDPAGTAEVVKNAIISALAELQGLSREQLVAQRRERLLGYGMFRET